jgi:DNA recombination protein RmuC
MREADTSVLAELGDVAIAMLPSAWVSSPGGVAAGVFAVGALLLAFSVLVAVVLGGQLWRTRRALRNASASAGEVEQALSQALEHALREELRASRGESAVAARDLRSEVTTGLHSASELLVGTVSEMGKHQGVQLESVTKQLAGLTEANELRIERLRKTIDHQLGELQTSNEKKLDAMRQTVDERLQSTLEKRLGESFKLVGDRLEAVQKGLGEMKNLAAGVGDLKRVLTNVKTRGAWGEVQLGAILEQLLTAEQYDRNVQTKLGSREHVEFAIRLPGSDPVSGPPVWLPIDSKFPQEDYLRLKQAADDGDAEAVEKASGALRKAVTVAAKDIAGKYLNPPATTDFAMLFLPTEGLFAEVIRIPGLLEELQQHHRVVIAGPTTLAAILNSLRLGFRTLAIEQRASEVWQILAAVKTEFGKFGDVLAKVKSQLDTASNTIDQTGVRTRVIERKLRDVESLPIEDTRSVLGDGEAQLSLVPGGDDEDGLGEEGEGDRDESR